VAGVNLVRIGYKGSGPALIDVMAGQVKVMFATTTSSWGHVKSGKLKALAITSAEPSALAPGLPTIAASGVPGYAAESIYGVWAPAKTPAAIVSRLHRELVLALGKADVKERLLKGGVEAVGSSPEELGAYVKADIAKIEILMRNAGIKGVP